jgi:hypothetical protein
MPVIPACGRLTLEDHKFKATLGYKVRNPTAKEKRKEKKEERQWSNTFKVVKEKNCHDRMIR